MKKKSQKKTKTTIREEVDQAGPLDWTPLFSAFTEAFEWALDVATRIARDYPEEVDAVERVRAFMRKRLAGDPAHIDVEDILFTFGLVIGAIERDLGPVPQLAPWFAQPPRMRFPSVHELWERSFPRQLTGLGLRVRPVAYPNA